MGRIRIEQIGIGHNHGEVKMLAVRKFPELFEVVGIAEPNEEWLRKRGNLAGYIGSETVVLFAKDGYNVAVCDINGDLINKTIDRIEKAGTTAKGYVADVTDSSDIEKAINSAAEDFGGIDVMVHIAGGKCKNRRKRCKVCVSC